MPESARHSIYINCSDKMHMVLAVPGSEVEKRDYIDPEMATVN